MKKFFAVLIWLFGTIALLTSCSSNKAPSCELTLTSTETSVSYSLSFADLGKKQTSYKIEILKGETSVKEEVSSTDVTAGQFSNLDLNTSYKVNVYVTNKTEWDVSLASKDIQTKKGTITGVTFNSQSFVYDGTAKSIEVSNLPAGTEVTYSGNSMTDVGEYTVTATVKKENYEDLVLTAKLTITQASSDFVISDKTVTYTGEAQTIKAITDLEVTYEYYLGETKLESAPVNAGTYTVKAIYAGDKNHAKVEKSATLKIEKAASAITAEDITIKFGEEYDVVATCSVADASLTLEYYQGETKLDEKPTAIGSYSVKVIFDGNDNYKASSKTIALLITNPDNADVTITLDNISTVYGQTYVVAPTADHGVVLEDLVIKYYQLDGTEIEKPINAGNYEIKITYAGNEDKFLNPASKTVTLTIAKADYDLSGITFADVTYTYDGEEHRLVITGTLPSGVNVSYTNNILTEIGEIEVTATFTGDENNYNLIAPKTAVLKIVKQIVTFTQSVQLTYGDTIDSSNLLSYMSYSGVTEQAYNQIKNEIVATLPDGVTGITNAGIYAIHITFAGTDYINALDVDVNLVVDKATHTIEVVGLEDNTITRVAGSLFNYTANAQTDAQYTYSQDLRYASAGTYTDLVITFEENENYLAASKTINVVLTAPTAATDLFISEYYEGASNNKFIIIYNGTGAEVDLSEYSITLAVNGAIYDLSKNTNGLSTIDTNVLTLANQGRLAICHNSTSQDIKTALTNAGCIVVTSTAICNFNGDDTVLLNHNNKVIDVFGEATGTDPGNGWAFAGVLNATMDHHFVRASYVFHPSALYNNGYVWNQEEWICYSDLTTFDMTNDYVMNINASKIEAVELVLSKTDYSLNSVPTVKELVSNLYSYLPELSYYTFDGTTYTKLDAAPETAGTYYIGFDSQEVVVAGETLQLEGSKCSFALGSNQYVNGYLDDSEKYISIYGDTNFDYDSEEHSLVFKQTAGNGFTVTYSDTEYTAVLVDGVYQVSFNLENAGTYVFEVLALAGGEYLSYTHTYNVIINKAAFPVTTEYSSNGTDYEAYPNGGLETGNYSVKLSSAISFAVSCDELSLSNQEPTASGDGYEIVISNVSSSTTISVISADVNYNDASVIITIGENPDDAWSTSWSTLESGTYTMLLAAVTDDATYIAKNSLTSGKLQTVDASTISNESAYTITVVVNKEEGKVQIQIANGKYLGYGTSGTNFKEEDTAVDWTITKTADEKNEYLVYSNRAFICNSGATNKPFGPYSTTNVGAAAYPFLSYKIISKN